MARTPDQIAADWASRMGASRDKIQQGVMAVTVAPGQAAAAQADVWVQNVQASKPKWAARVAAVSVQDWQQDMISKGLDRIAPGATAAQGKFTNFMAQLLPFQSTLKGQLPKRGTLDQNIARSNAWIRGMAAFAYRR